MCKILEQKLQDSKDKKKYADIGNVKNGDEISVYYDGKYAKSIFVTGGPLSSADGDLSDLEDLFSNINLTIYDPKGAKAGDEVSVYYDGVFITKLTIDK